MHLNDSPLLTLRSASFGYADRMVVDRVTLTIAAGDIVALLGPNGSGKSTLVRGVLGLADLLGGEVELCGTSITQFRDKPLIGYVPQRHTLASTVRATVREIVAVGRLPLRPWWKPATAADTEAVDAALDAVGLRERGGDDVATLSGGQQRRVLIARALTMQPRLLIMDEPTAGVDAANQDVLAQVMRRLADQGTSMLIVTHELAALRGVVNRIVCLDNGQVDFDGVPSTYAAHLARSGHPLGGDHHHDDDSHDSGSAAELAPGVSAVVAQPLPPRPRHG